MWTQKRMQKGLFWNIVMLSLTALCLLGLTFPGCAGAASPRVGGSVVFPEDNQIDTGQTKRKGRTQEEGSLEETGRRAEPQGVQDIINNIVNLLGGNVNLHTANEPQHSLPVFPQNRLPFNRINNRGPPRQGELPFEAIPLEPANANKRPQNPFAPNGIQLPLQIVPTRQGPFATGPVVPQRPLSIPLRPPVRVTPPPLPELYPFGANPNAINNSVPAPVPPIPSSTTTTTEKLEEHTDVDESYDYYPTNDTPHEDTNATSDDSETQHSEDAKDSSENHPSDPTQDESSVQPVLDSEGTSAPVDSSESHVDGATVSTAAPVDTVVNATSDVAHDSETDGEAHYEYEDEPSAVNPLEISQSVDNSDNLVNTTAQDTSVVEPSMEEIVVPSVIVPVPVTTYSVISTTKIVPLVPTNPPFRVVQSPDIPTPPLQGKPGMVFADEELPYRGMGSLPKEPEPSMFWIKPNQMQGDIFELTVNAAQNFGGGVGNGATQTFRIPAAGRPVVEPVDIEDLRGEDGILTVARPGDEFVSIDGKRTYFNLFPDGMQTVGPTPFQAAPVVDPTSLHFYQPRPPQDQIIHQERPKPLEPVVAPRPRPVVPPVQGAAEPVQGRPGVAEAVPVQGRPGVAEAVPVQGRPGIPEAIPVQGRPVGSIPPKPQLKPQTPAKSDPSGVGTFEVDEPPVKGPPPGIIKKPKPATPKDETPLRIDTCQEGDDSTCEVGETCKADHFGASCFCRNGWGRKNPRLSCVELVNFALSLRLDRLSGKQVTFSKDLENPLTPAYRELTTESKTAIDSLLTRSLLPIYIGSEITGFDKHNGRVISNISLQFEASPITTSPSFRNELNRQLTNTIEGFSNRLGSSQLFVDGTQSPVISIQDIDECQNEDSNDCSANATCKNNLGSFSCACKVGFTDKANTDPRMVGRLCVPAVCSNDYCHNRGDCRMEGPKRVCYCRGSFGGAQCDIDTEVVGVALGASVTAILIIVITLVGLCWWSRRWRRDQDSDLGMPRYPGKVSGQMALALPYATQYGRPPMPAPQYYMPAFIHPPLDYELSSMHSYDVLSHISTMRRPIAPTLSLPPQLEGRRRPAEVDEGLVGAVRTWYRRVSRKQHAPPSSMSVMGVPAYPNPYMEHPISRPKRTGSVISHGKSRRAPPPPSQPPPPLIEFSEDRASLSSGLYDSIDDKRSLQN